LPEPRPPHPPHATIEDFAAGYTYIVALSRNLTITARPARRAPAVSLVQPNLPSVPPSCSCDVRYHLEAVTIKRELEAELERIPGAPPRTRRSDHTWGHRLYLNEKEITHPAFASLLWGESRLETATQPLRRGLQPLVDTRTLREKIRDRIAERA
jgi:hypothetical protein